MPGRTRPTLIARRTYDTAEVDAVVDGLLAEIERIRDERDEALLQVRELEGREPAEAPTEVLGRAMLLVQQIADTIVADARAEAAEILAAAGTGTEARDGAGTREEGSRPEPAPPESESGRPTSGEAMLARLGERMDSIRSKLSSPAGDETPGAVASTSGTDGANAVSEPEPEATEEPTPGDEPGESRAEHPQQVPAAALGAPSWIRADRTDDHGDVDYFAALRQALEDGEPLGPRDEVVGPRQNGSRHLGPVLRGIPLFVAVAGFASAAGLRPH